MDRDNKLMALLYSVVILVSPKREEMWRRIFKIIPSNKPLLEDKTP